MNRNDFISQYWHYYLALEEDFVRTTRFVEIDEDNFKTFSIEYNKQLQSICSEVDVLCKDICLHYNVSNANGISEYAKVILKEYDDITSRIVEAKQYMGVEINPFLDWTLTPKHKSPDWWRQYNGIKHDRLAKYKDANLANVINSLAGLYLLEMYFLKSITKNNDNEPDIPDVPSNLFEIKNWETRYSDLSKTILYNI